MIDSSRDVFFQNIIVIVMYDNMTTILLSVR